MFSVVLSVGLCVAVSDLRNEDIAKLDCFCCFYLSTLFKTKGCERHFIFMKRVPASKTFENLYYEVTTTTVFRVIFLFLRRCIGSTEDL